MIEKPNKSQKDSAHLLTPKYNTIRIRPRSVEHDNAPENEKDNINVVGSRIKRYRNKTEKFRNSLK